MKNSEILMALMECAFEDALPADAPSLRDCMRLYSELRREEERTEDSMRRFSESIRKLTENGTLAGLSPQTIMTDTLPGKVAFAKVDETSPDADDAEVNKNEVIRCGEPPAENAAVPEEPDTGDTHTHTHTHTGGQTVGCAAPSAEAADAQKNPPEGFVPVQTFHGKGSAEKRQIYERLLQFRKARGLGCLMELAKATNGVLDADTIRNMMHGEKAELASWKIVNAAMDYVEKEKKK